MRSVAEFVSLSPFSLSLLLSLSLLYLTRLALEARDQLGHGVGVARGLPDRLDVGDRRQRGSGDERSGGGGSRGSGRRRRGRGRRTEDNGFSRREQLRRRRRRRRHRNRRQGRRRVRGGHRYLAIFWGEERGAKKTGRNSGLFFFFFGEKEQERFFFREEQERGERREREEKKRVSCFLVFSFPLSSLRVRARCSTSPRAQGSKENKGVRKQSERERERRHARFVTVSRRSSFLPLTPSEKPRE